MSDLEWNRSEQEAWEDLMSEYPSAEAYIDAAYHRDREIDELRKRIRDLEERTAILAGTLNQLGPLLSYLNSKKRGTSYEQHALKGTL
jgi:hypothetical protein